MKGSFYRNFYSLLAGTQARSKRQQLHARIADSLMARLDRLAPVKEVAQIGAAIGREFSRDLLAAVAPMSDRQQRDALDHEAQELEPIRSWSAPR